MLLSINTSMKHQVWNIIVKLVTPFVVFYLIVLLFSIDKYQKVDMPLAISVIYIISLLVSTIDNFTSLWHIKKEKARYYFIGLVPFYIFILYKLFTYQELFNYKVDFYITMLYGLVTTLLMVRYLIVRQLKNTLF